MLKKILVVLVSLMFCVSAFSALTIVKNNALVMGNVKGSTYSLTFTSVVAGAVDTGMSQLIYASFVPGSDGSFDTHLNYSDAGATRAYGQVYLDSVDSGATGTLFVLGY